MADLDVRIVTLEPLRVVMTYGFGPEPELIAWDKLRKWAGKQGIALGEQRLFGFNNPDPSTGSPNYGYEQWMVVGPEIEASGEVTVKEVPGGLYAVTRCAGLHIIMEMWQALVRWREQSPYIFGNHQYLEECLTPDATALEDYLFDLYLPIAA
jgi:DNA gyrase inhibitor GyrI